MVFNSMKLLLLWLLLFAASAAGAQTSDRDLFNQAETRFRVGDYELALDRYETLVREHPSSRFVPDAQFRIAVTLHRLEQYEEALNALRRVELRFRSTQYLPLIPFWQGLSHFYLQNYEDAHAALTQFLDTQPGHPVARQALLYRALSDREMGNDAGPDAQRILELTDDPAEEPFAVTLLMRSRLSEERFQRVIDVFDRLNMDAIEDEWAPRIMLYAAEAYYALGQEREAMALFQELEDAEAEIAGIALERLFSFAQAENDLTEADRIVLQAEQVLASRPELRIGFWERVGIQSYRNDRPDVAELYLNRVWEARSRYEISAAAVGHLSELRRQRGEIESATAMLEETIDGFEGQDRERLLARLGGLYLEQDEYDRASETFSRVTEEFPDGEQFVAAAYQRAYAEVQAGNSREAMDILTNLFNEGQTSGLLSELRRLQAQVATQTGDLETAATAWRDLLTLEPSDVTAGVEYARVLFRQERYDRVLDQTEEIFELMDDIETGNPTNELKTRYLAGLSSLIEQEYNQAVEYLTVFADEPTEENVGQDIRRIRPYGRFYLGWAHYRLGNWGSAYAILSELGTESASHELTARSLYVAGWSAYISGDYESAVEVLTYMRGIELSPTEQVESRYLLAQALRSQGSNERALTELRTIYRDYSDSEYADDSLFEYAELLASLGRTEDAAERFAGVFERYPESPLAEDALYRRGDVYFQDRDYENARDAWLEHRSEFPDGRLTAGSLFYGGVASYELGESGSALLVWERLIREFRDSAFRYDAMVRAADLYVQRGELREALNLLTETVARYPERAVSADLQSRIDELVLRIGGLGEQEASLLVEIERNDRARSSAGRDAIITLSRLVIYESVGESVNRRLILPLLREVVAQEDESGRDASEAQFLIGEWYFQQGDLLDAAEAFVDAAELGASNQDLAAQSLFRAAQSYRQADRPRLVREIVAGMEAGYENSDWTAEALRLLEGL